MQNEILFIGGIYSNPEFLIEYSQYIKSKYDFSDKATKFFYDIAEIIFTKRTQTFNKTTITTFMTEYDERLRLYKQYGGWKTLENWMQLSRTEDFKNYYEVLKKYSLIREYDRNGFNVQKILSHPKFELFTAVDVARLIRGKADRIQTVIMTNEQGEVLNKGVKATIWECMERPDMGLQTPYYLWNELFRGLRLETILVVGMLSNAGKSRFMFKLICYISLVLKEKTLVLPNEMTIKQMRFCLITTVLNNKEFQEENRIKLTKKEREITLGLYHDDSGNFIYRKTDDWGDFIESVDEYIKRVEANSSEYVNIMRVSEWIENETEGLIFAQEISSSYDDKTLEFEIKKASLTHGVHYVFYDTLKDEVSKIGDWSGLKVTTTKLSELAKQLKLFVYGSIQLTDDAIYVDPDQLSSMNIANCKQLKHIVDTLLLFKEISLTEQRKYGYIASDVDWGEPSVHDLDPNKRYYCGIVDKNRAGEKKKIIYEVNLDYNTWYECGELVRK